MSAYDPTHEETQFHAEVKDVERWFQSPRWRNTTRPYAARDVVALRGTVTPEYVSNITAKKLWALVEERFRQRSFTNTFGALDPVQVVQMAPHIETVYVSGWQCSSTASTTNEPGPDFADYPSDTVPCKVDQLFRAQLFHDRRQREARSRMTPAERRASPPVDFLRPIIADGDTGHGGLTSVMKMMKIMVERGAAGVHIEDQKPGVKKCGHMGGKVLVPMREQVDRMVAARLQCDVMGTDTILVARTDADSATQLDNNSDERDHPFIVGATVPGTRPLNEVVAEAVARGEKDLDAISVRWEAEAGVKRYAEAVADELKAKFGGAAAAPKLREWEARALELSITEARALARSLGVDPYFDWDAPRSREGFYRIKGGLDYAIARARAFAPFSDMIWMETATPSVEECRGFAAGVHAVYPEAKLAYNLSPSFNWDAAGMDDAQIARFEADIGRLGFVWHFITLAGFHSNSLVVTRFARDYAKRGVVAYVQGVQRPERDEGVETLKHQMWSGAELADRAVAVASGGVSSTASMGAGVTEAQFAKH